MHYEIDVSGRIEQTNKDTVVAITNHSNFTVKIDRKEKRRVERHFKGKRHKLNTYLNIFAYLLAILIKEVRPKNKVIIDNEYIGNERYILEKVHIFLEKFKVKAGMLHLEFGHVGKLSSAHILAYNTATKKTKDSVKVAASDLINFLENI